MMETEPAFTVAAQLGISTVKTTHKAPNEIALAMKTFGLRRQKASLHSELLLLHPCLTSALE